MHRHRSWLKPNGSLLGSDGDPPGFLVGSERVRLNHFIKFNWFGLFLDFQWKLFRWLELQILLIARRSRRVRKNASDSQRNWERKRHFFKKFFYLLLLSFWRSTIKVGLCQRPYSLWQQFMACTQFTESFHLKQTFDQNSLEQRKGQ